MSVPVTMYAMVPVRAVPCQLVLLMAEAPAFSASTAPLTFSLPQRLTLRFHLATSGAELGNLDVALPWNFNAEEVAKSLDTCLLGLSVMNGLSMPLFQYLSPTAREAQAEHSYLPLTSLALEEPVFSTEQVDELELLLVATRPLLVNLRGLHAGERPAGWRRWSKEFHQFVQDLPLPELRLQTVPSYGIKNRQQCFGKADFRRLAPIILQAFAGACRMRIAGPIRAAAERGRPFAWGGPAAGRRYRTWKGCQHALALLTGQKANEVQKFINAWLQAMEDALVEVEQQIAEEPFKTFFK